jgi:hypothetical protein
MSLSTVEELALRRTVLREAAPGDWELGNRLMRELQAAQLEDGSWAGDLDQTGACMLAQLDLDVVSNHPSLELAAEWVLDHLEPVLEGALPFTRNQVPALLALLRMGRQHELAVQRVVSQLAFDAAGWLPTADRDDIALAVKLLLADPVARSSPVVLEALERLIEAAQAAEPTEVERCALLDLCGLTELPSARDWVVSQVPFVIDGQREDGGWGEHTAVVVRALCTHGLWEPLLP